MWIFMCVRVYMCRCVRVWVHAYTSECDVCAYFNIMCVRMLVSDVCLSVHIRTYIMLCALVYAYCTCAHEYIQYSSKAT